MFDKLSYYFRLIRRYFLTEVKIFHFQVQLSTRYTTPDTVV